MKKPTNHEIAEAERASLALEGWSFEVESSNYDREFGGHHIQIVADGSDQRIYTTFGRHEKVPAILREIARQLEDPNSTIIRQEVAMAAKRDAEARAIAARQAAEENAATVACEHFGIDPAAIDGAIEEGPRSYVRQI